jgi:molybdate transport system substrate-binding protein
MRSLSKALLILTVLFSCTAAKLELQIFTASSMYSSIVDLGEEFTKDSGIPVVVVPAASGVLAKQIAMGADADIYISASGDWVEFLDALLDFTDRQIFVSNRLALISNKNIDANEIDAHELVAAIGDPEYVPAGRYSLQVMENHKIDYGSVIYCSNVRHVLRLVQMGEADIGYVYITDVDEKVNFVKKFPESSHDPIDYHSVLLSESKESRMFFDFLLHSDIATEYLVDKGFERGDNLAQIEMKRD